jgi:hypothetical protein
MYNNSASDDDENADADANFSDAPDVEGCN